MRLTLVLLALTGCGYGLESPTPVLDEIEPVLVCNDLDTTVTVHGSGLSPAPIDILSGSLTMRVPDLTIIRTHELDGTAVEETVVELDEESGDVRWFSQELMEFDVLAEMALPVGVYAVRAENLAAQEGAVDAVTAVLAQVLASVPPPALYTIAEELVCTEQYANTFTLTGAGFLVVDGQMPTVTIGSFSSQPDRMEGNCVDVVGPPVSGQICDSLVVTVPMGQLAVGVHDVFVTNPAPADCVTSELVQLEVVGAPVVDALIPPDICSDAGEAEIEIVGDNFLVLGGGTTPTVAVGVETFAVSDTAGCALLAGPAGGEICTSLFVTVPEGTFPTVDTFHAVVVTNPAPAQCVSNDDVDLGVVPPPTIDDVIPDPVCTSNESFTVTGTGFQPGASVEVDGSAFGTTSWVSDTEVTVSFQQGALTEGPHDVTVLNPDGCEATGVAVMDVVAGPFLFFVDPPVLWNGTTIQINLYVSGITGDIVRVWIEEDATSTTYTLYDSTSGLPSPFDGVNTVSVPVPAATLGLAEGTYTVFIEDTTGCTPQLESALYVEADLDLGVLEIEPGFAWTDATTPVDIRAKATPDLGASEVQFADLPRVYLNPAAGGTAKPLTSSSYQTPTLVNAVVPKGLPVGSYDVIVVNPPPGNQIGVLFDALLVTQDPPPHIDFVSPIRVDKTSITEVVIQGSDFRNPAVYATCQLPGTATTIDLDPLALTATFPPTATEIHADMNGATYGEGAVCVLRVENDDGTFHDYSAVSVGASSGNLFTWDTGLSMGTARRAPAAVAGRATDRARYLYAIGGDSGAATGAMSSIEVTPLDVFGNMIGWYDLDVDLAAETSTASAPGARTLAGVALMDRFIYVVGGEDDTGPVDSVLRAQILDPLEAPQFKSLGLNFGTTSGTDGLDGGRYQYRISAVFDETDAVNPSGESLASDPIVVNLPQINPHKVYLTVEWEPVGSTVAPVGYNVYRSAAAGGASGSEVFIAFVTGTSLQDTGLAPTTNPHGSPNDWPLDNGSLGRWDEVAVLPHDSTGTDDPSRSSPCVALGRDPTDRSQAYLYVAGGQDGTSTYRDTVHILAIDGSDPDQPVGAWSAATNPLPEAKSRCGAFVVDSTYHSVVTGSETWIYFGPGFNGGRTTATQAGRIVADTGDLELWVADAGGVNPGRSSYASFSAANYLFILAGERQSNPAMEGGTETEIDGPPGLKGWSSLASGGLPTGYGRVFPGSAIESAVIFIVGGADGSSTAQADVFTNNF